MANIRQGCCAIGLDWHGFVVERAIADLDNHPEEVVYVAMRNAARAYALAVKDLLAGAASTNIHIKPNELWEIEQAAMLAIARQKPQISHESLLHSSNVLVLEKLFPELIKNLTQGAKRKLARKVRKARKRNNTNAYTMHPDVRKVITQLSATKLAPLYVVTGQDRSRVDAQALQCQVSMEQFGTRNNRRVYTAQEFSSHKMSPRFWNQLLRLLELQPHEFLMIGNEVLIDAACVQAGIPVIIFDRGGIKEEYYRKAETRYGVPYRSVYEDIPPRAPFIGFAKNTGELWQWIERFFPAEETSASAAPSS